MDLFTRATSIDLEILEIWNQNIAEIGYIANEEQIFDVRGQLHKQEKLDMGQIDSFMMVS